MSNLVQQILVSLVALVAAGYVVRQIVDMFRPGGDRHEGCDHCAVNPDAPPRPEDPLPR